MDKKSAIFTLVLLLLVAAVLILALDLCPEPKLQVGDIAYLDKSAGCVSGQDWSYSIEWCQSRLDNCPLERGAVEVLQISPNQFVLVRGKTPWGSACKGWIPGGRISLPQQ